MAKRGDVRERESVTYPSMRLVAIVAVLLSGILLLWRSSPGPRSEPVPTWGDTTLLDVAMQASADHGDPAPFSIRYVRTTHAAARAYAFGAASPAPAAVSQPAGAPVATSASPTLAGSAPVYLVVARGYYRGATDQRLSLVAMVDVASGRVLAARVSDNAYRDLSRLGRVVVLHFVPEAGGRSQRGAAGSSG